MGLYSHTNPNGDREIVIDFPYYLSSKKAKYFETRDRDTALNDARRHVEWAEMRFGRHLWTIVDRVEKQSVILTMIEPKPNQTSAKD